MLKGIIKSFLTLSVIILGFYLFIFIYHPKVISTEVIHQEIVATTWGWSKIVSTPTRITVTTNGAARFFTSQYIDQVKFSAGDGPINTALIIKPTITGYWKVGDEVLIAQIPGTVGDVPSPTFIVIDHRSQEQKK